ncbi:MAG: radical SAM protein [Nitrospirae bacterium]|nr:radical SAM protein [Nitrospirota bacterium]
MSIETLELVFIRINEYLSAKTEEKITLIWHGGEPLLLGVEYFNNALKFQNRHCPDTKSRIEHAIQSNITLFSEEYADIFRKIGISNVGSSFDPESNVRGPGQNIDSDKYNRMYMKGDSILSACGFGSGLIYVVTKKSLNNPLRTFFFLTNLKLKGAVNMNPVLVYDEKRMNIAITPDEYVEFLGAIFPTWWEHSDRYPEINPFKSLTKNIKNRQQSLGCADSGMCAYSHVNIAPDGEVSHCGRSSDWDILPYGKIYDRTLIEVFADEQRKVLFKRNEVLLEGECKRCRFWTICHGGCPLDAYSEHKSFMHKTKWCIAKRGFIEKYFEPITGLRFEPYAE